MWGYMLSEARTYTRNVPWLAIFPILAVSLVIVSANMLGDAVRDMLEPHLSNTC